MTKEQIRWNVFVRDDLTCQACRYSSVNHTSRDRPIVCATRVPASDTIPDPRSEASYVTLCATCLGEQERDRDILHVPDDLFDQPTLEEELAEIRATAEEWAAIIAATDDDPVWCDGCGAFFAAGDQFMGFYFYSDLHRVWCSCPAEDVPDEGMLIVQFYHAHCVPHDQEGAWCPRCRRQPGIWS